jgi:hypothetical protein
MAANIINLEKDLPTVEAAMTRLRWKFQPYVARNLNHQDYTWLWLERQCGAIRTATRQYLSELLKEGKIKPTAPERFSALLKTPAGSLCTWRRPCAKIPTGARATMA